MQLGKGKIKRRRDAVRKLFTTDGRRRLVGKIEDRLKLIYSERQTRSNVWEEEQN